MHLPFDFIFDGVASLSAAAGHGAVLAALLFILSFLRKQDLMFHANCLQWRQFA